MLFDTAIRVSQKVHRLSAAPCAARTGGRRTVSSADERNKMLILPFRQLTFLPFPFVQRTSGRRSWWRSTRSSRPPASWMRSSRNGARRTRRRTTDLFPTGGKRLEGTASLCPASYSMVWICHHPKPLQRMADAGTVPCVLV